MTLGALRRIQRLLAYVTPACAFAFGAVAFWRAGFALNLVLAELFIAVVAVHAALALYKRSFGLAARFGHALIEATREDSESERLGPSDLPDKALSWAGVATVSVSALVLLSYHPQ